MSSGQEMGNVRPARRSAGVTVDVAAGRAVIVGGAGVGFRVDRAVIPVGIRCERCGVSHLPARVIAARTSGGRRAGPSIRLRCPRCAAVSEIALNGSSEPADLLDVLGVDWRDGGSADPIAG